MEAVKKGLFLKITIKKEKIIRRTITCVLVSCLLRLCTLSLFSKPNLQHSFCFNIRNKQKRLLDIVLDQSH